MEIDWDKEFDSLLRGAVPGETIPEKEFDAEDLGADEIAAFAENVLPPDARLRVAAKLADSAHGRQILSNLIKINEAAEAEETAAISKSMVAVPVKSGLSEFFTKFFTFQTLGFAGAALSVLIIGTIAFFVFRQNSANELAMSKAEKPYLKSADSAANTSVMSNSNAAGNAASTVSNTSVANTNSAGNMTRESANTLSNAAVSVNKEPSLPTPAPAENRTVNMARKADSAGKNQFDTLRDRDTATNEMNEPEATKSTPAPISAPPTGAQTQPAKPATDAKTDDRSAENKQAEDQARRAETLSAPNPVPKPMASSGAAESASEKDENAKKSKTVAKRAVETRTVNGKSFRRENGAWIDSAYNSQPTTDVSRGSANYQKLDSGLRLTAEKLGGAVIIIWNGKAYRVN